MPNARAWGFSPKASVWASCPRRACCRGRSSPLATVRGCWGWEENGRYREREVARPFPYTDHASLFDLTGVRVHRWTLADGAVVTSPDGWTEPEHGEVSQTIRTLTGHHLVIPNSAVLYVAD